MDRKIGPKTADLFTATAKPDQKPVRSATKPNAYSRQGTFASFKNGFAQQYESSLERSCLEWLEINPAVRRYQTQPLQVEYRARGKVRRATPDIRVQTSGGIIIIDVKPMAQLAKQAVRQKLSEVCTAMNRRGYAYKVFSEREIFAEPQRSTVEELRYWQWFPLPEQTLEKLATLAKRHTTFSLEELIQQYGSSEESDAISRAFMLMAQGYTAFEFGKPLSLSLSLSLRSRE